MAKTVEQSATAAATEAQQPTTDATTANAATEQPTAAAAPTTDAATEQAFPGTADTRTVTDVDKEIKDANAALRVQHLDALEAKINELGGYAVSQLKPFVDQLRGVV
jgi:hypothetical protein